jgi:hypothetical protein
VPITHALHRKVRAQANIRRSHHVPSSGLYLLRRSAFGTHFNNRSDKGNCFIGGSQSLDSLSPNLCLLLLVIHSEHSVFCQSCDSGIVIDTILWFVTASDSSRRYRTAESPDPGKTGMTYLKNSLSSVVERSQQIV